MIRIRATVHSILLVVCLAAAGCSETSLISSPGSEPPTRVNAVIEVVTDHPTDPHTLDFGEVYAGETAEKDVTIRNIGDDTLQVQDLSLSNTLSFAISNTGDFNQLLVPDESTVVRVAYSPVQDEHIEGSLVIASNDREQPEVPVRLLAEGLAPAVDIQPPSFDFGNSELGCVGQLEIQISNVGRAPLEISEIRYEDLAGNGELSLSNTNPVAFVLNPNEFTTVEVHYVPTDVDPDSGILSVVTNTPSEPEGGSTAQQFGIAHLGEDHIDQFIQEGNNQTDILFTVDNSCSMSAEQSALAANFASFLGIVQALDIAFQLGVVTTDIGDDGMLQGSTPIIKPDTSNAETAFSENVNLGTSGAIEEQGFHSAYLATEAAQLGVGPNATFLRPDAGLRIVFVSDEQEQSDTAGLGWATPDYVNYFQSLKDNPEHVVLSDITGGLSSCNGAGGSATTGSEYVMATQLTGGISASICDPFWVSTLSALGWLSQSFADTFELSQTPVPETIEVRLQDVPLFLGWVYDSALNAVVFDIDHVPSNDQTIDVQYTVLGDCSD